MQHPMPSLSIMQAATQQWTDQLEAATRNALSESSRELQKSFRKDHLPDPISLMKRLSVLESTLEKLSTDCTSISTQKQQVLPSLLALQAENWNLVQKITDNQGKHDAEFEAIASTIRAQRQLFPARHHDYSS